MSLFQKTLSIKRHSLWLVTEHLLLPRIENAKNVSVNAGNRELMTAAAIAISPSLTAILAGILRATVFIMDMIYICSWIPKATCLCFHTIPVHLNMIPMDFCTHFSG